METSEKSCTACSEETDTQERLESIRPSSDSPIATNPRKRNSRRQKSDETPISSEPVVVNTQTSTEGESQSNSDTTTISDIKNREPVSDDPNGQLYIQPSIPPGFDEFSPAQVFAVGRYDTDDYRAHAYSEKLVEFSKESNQSHLPFFETQLNGFFQHRLGDKLSPDLITTYPGHAGGYHDGLVALAQEVASDRGFRYKPVLSRRDPRPSQRSLTGHERWENQLWSLQVEEDVDGKTIFLFDDVCTTGASLTTGTNNLLNAGAERVICVCLGLAKGQRGEYVKQLRNERHTIMNTINDDE